MKLRRCIWAEFLMRLCWTVWCIQWCAWD